MKKITLPDILDIYYADGDSGCIYVIKGGKRNLLRSHIERGGKQPRVSLRDVNGGIKKYSLGYLILGAYEGFKDKKLYEYRFRNDNPADTRLKNLGWVEKFGFIDALNDDEYRLFREKIEVISKEACVAFSRYMNYRLKTNNNLAGYSAKGRKRFFEKLMSVDIQQIKNINDAVNLSFINLKETTSNENN